MISHIGWDTPYRIQGTTPTSDFRFKVSYSDMCVLVYAFFGVTLDIE